jgi:hypothetical protein
LAMRFAPAQGQFHFFSPHWTQESLINEGVLDPTQKLEWLTIQGRTLAESSQPNPLYVKVGINIDDDQTCFDARVRFGLVLNDQGNIVTLDDTAGFGAQAYYTADCDLEGLNSGWATASGFGPGRTSTAPLAKSGSVSVTATPPLLRRPSAPGRRLACSETPARTTAGPARADHRTPCS